MMMSNRCVNAGVSEEYVQILDGRLWGYNVHRFRGNYWGRAQLDLLNSPVTQVGMSLSNTLKATASP